MTKIDRFEDLEIWQLARELAKDIYEITLRNSMNSENDLKWQIRKSSGSVMDNIAEGFERNGKKEFIQFLSIAKGSLGEIRSQLYRIMDRKPIIIEEFNSLNEKTNIISRKTSALMNYLKNSDKKGLKYKSNT